MLRREIKSHLLVTLFWLGIITLLRCDWRLDLIFLWAGGLGGTFLLDVDHLFYTLVIYPHELTSMRVRRLIERGRFKSAVELLIDTHRERKRLALHSVAFQAVLPIFAFFVLTSTGSMLGTGLVMGLYLHSLRDQFRDLENLGHINNWFWQIKKEVSLYSQKLFVILMFLVFLGLNLFLI